MHIAVGGMELFTNPTPSGADPVYDSNGDMGCNETASYDPLFYFHHAFIDYVFWVWIQRHRATADDIQAQLNQPEYRYYPGTNSSDEQGATIGIPPNTRLTLLTPLEPFENLLKTAPSKLPNYYTGFDAFALNASIGYKGGSLESYINPPPPSHSPPRSHKALVVSGINRNLIHGSYIVYVFGEVVDKDGLPKQVLLDSESVLSRWHVQGCANCQTHVTRDHIFAIPDNVRESSIQVTVNTHDSENPSGPVSISSPAFQQFNIHILKS